MPLDLEGNWLESYVEPPSSSQSPAEGQAAPSSATLRYNGATVEPIWITLKHKDGEHDITVGDAQVLKSYGYTSESVKQLDWSVLEECLRKAGGELAPVEGEDKKPVADDYESQNELRRAWQKRVREGALLIEKVLLPRLLEGGRFSNGSYLCASSNGGKGNSFEVKPGGSWIDRNNKDINGRNLVDLYAHVKGIDWRDAYDELTKLFGIAKPPAPTAKKNSKATAAPADEYRTRNVAKTDGWRERRENIERAALVLLCYKNGASGFVGKR